jgi:ATP-binding cassette subfamily B protein
MKRPRTLARSWAALRRILAQFGPLVRRQRWLLAGGTLAVMAEAFFRALEPWPIKFVFDRAFGSKQHHRFHSLPALDDLNPTTLVSVAALAIVILTALRAVASYVGTLAFVRAGNRVLTQVRADVYDHLQRLSLTFHARARGGDLVLRVLSDVNMIKDVLITALLPLLANFLVLVGMFAVMFWLNSGLALVALAALPLFGLSAARMGRRIRQAAKNQRKRDAALAAGAAETVGAITVVQALGLEGLLAEGFRARNEASRRQDMKGARLSAALARTIGFLIAAATALVLWYGSRLVLRGELTPGDLLVFMAYLKNALRPVQDFAKYTGRLAKATAAGERVLDLLRQEPEVRDLPGAVAAPPLRGAVRFEDVRFEYVPGRPVLDGIDFAVEAGRRVAVVGESGAGKSTLVRLLLRLHDPTGGRVLIDGHDIRTFTLTSLRAQVSVVLQEALLFATSARDNIAYGRLGVAPEEVEAAGRLANAEEFVRALPQGYDTVLGERGLTLSGGQRQRIAIARAAVRRAPLLVLDEPATGLDGDNERAVLDALERLAEGRTTFIITHDLRLASRADEILLLEGGKVQERGGHAELMQAGGRYAALYRLQEGGPAPCPGANGDGAAEPLAVHGGQGP